MADNGKRILIVDDDQLNRDFYQELLQDAGFIVDIAGNGEEGLQKLETTDRYDLILLDIVMPVKDGIATLQALKTTTLRQKHGPIYMLSTLGQESVVQNAMELGADGYLVKSALSPEEMVEKVNSLVM